MNQNYIQIGIAPINPINEIGDEYKEHIIASPFLSSTQLVVGGSILIFILLITLIIYYCKIKQAADREDHINNEIIL